MQRIRDENINTSEFWDFVWEQEPEWWDGFGYTTDRWRALTTGLQPPAKILDVGGGRGELLGWLGPDYDRTILDHSRYAVDLAIAEGRAETGVVTDCNTIPFPDGTFDATFCCELLEHVEDPAALISELRRVTKPQGRVGVTTPHLNTVDDKQHVWSFDQDDLCALFWTEPRITVCSGPTMVAVACA